MLWLLSLACTDGSDATDSQTPADTADCTPYSWQSTGAPTLLTWCTPCHHSELAEEDRAEAPLGVDLNSYEGASVYASRIRARALDLGDMPPAGGPTPQELAELEAWLDCGALE